MSFHGWRAVAIRWRRNVATLALVVAALLAVTPAPAQAAGTRYDFAGNLVTSGVLRSHASGYYTVYNTSPTARSIAAGMISISDDSADGYRARVWYNVYSGCHCLNSGNRYIARAFDNTSGANTTVNVDASSASVSNASSIYYTVEIKVGRYDGDTGRYDAKTIWVDYITFS